MWLLALRSFLWRIVSFVFNGAVSKSEPDPDEFVVRSLWNNTHV